MAILTLSRQLGSGSGEIVRGAQTALRYAHVDRETLMNAIRSRGKQWEKWAQEFDETSPRFWEKYDRSFRGFQALLQSVLLDYALRDNVILTGRGANLLLEGIPHAYRIRLVAPMEERVERIASRESLDSGAARRLAEKTDKERAGFVHAMYGKDVNDPKAYDAIFDSGRQPLDEIVAVVKQALLERDQLKTEAAQRLIYMRTAAARVKAKLITDHRLYVPILDVEATNEEVVLQGVVRNRDEFRRIVQAAMELAEDAPLKVDLKYRM
jgi:cytidylate kinase